MAYRPRTPRCAPHYRLLSPRRTPLHRAFSTTTSDHSAFFQLGALSNSRETSYFNKFSGLSRVEHSPNLQLIRSSEVKPMESNKKHLAASSKSGGRKLVPITKVTLNKGLAAQKPILEPLATSTPSAKHIMRTVGKGRRTHAMQMAPMDEAGATTKFSSIDSSPQPIETANDQIPRSLRLTPLPNDPSSSAATPSMATLASKTPVPSQTIAATKSSLPHLSNKSLRALSLGQHILHSQHLARVRLRTALRKRIAAHRADKRAFVDAHYASFRAIIGARLTAILAMAVSVAVVAVTWTSPGWVMAQKEVAERGWRNIKGFLGGFVELGGIWGTRGREVRTNGDTETAAVSARDAEPVVDRHGKKVMVQSRPAGVKEDVVRGPAKSSSMSSGESIAKTKKANEGSGFSLNGLFWSGSR